MKLHQIALAALLLAAVGGALVLALRTGALAGFFALLRREFVRAALSPSPFGSMLRALCAGLALSSAAAAGAGLLGAGAFCLRLLSPVRVRR